MCVRAAAAITQPVASVDARPIISGLSPHAHSWTPHQGTVYDVQYSPPRQDNVQGLPQEQFTDGQAEIPSQAPVKQSYGPLESRELLASALDTLADKLPSKQDNLPKLKPEQFSGDLLNYPGWCKSVDAIAECNATTVTQKIFL